MHNSCHNAPSFFIQFQSDSLQSNTPPSVKTFDTIREAALHTAIDAGDGKHSYALRELKRLCHGMQSSLFCFVITTSYCSLWNFKSAKKLLLNDKIRALWQTDMPPERYI